MDSASGSNEPDQARVREALLRSSWVVVVIQVEVCSQPVGAFAGTGTDPASGINISGARQINELNSFVRRSFVVTFLVHWCGSQW